MSIPKEKKKLTLGQVMSWNRNVAREREQLYDTRTRELNPDASKTFAGYRKRVNDADATGARFEETQKLEQAMGTRGKWDFSNDGGYTTLWWKGRDATGRMTKIAYKKAKGSHGVSDFFSNPDLKLVEDWTPERHARAMKIILGENSKYAMTGQERQAKNLLDQTKRDLKTGGWKPAGGWANEFKSLPKAPEPETETWGFNGGPYTVEDSPLGHNVITRYDWDRAEKAGVLNQLLLNTMKYYEDNKHEDGARNLRYAIGDYISRSIRTKLNSEAPLMKPKEILEESLLSKDYMGRFKQLNLENKERANRRTSLEKVLYGRNLFDTDVQRDILTRASKRKKPISISEFSKWLMLPEYGPDEPDVPVEETPFGS